MARKIITNSELLIIQDDLATLKNKLPGLAFLFEPKIQFFYRQNQMNIRILHERMHEIQQKYIEHDADGRPIYATEEEGKPKDWNYKEPADCHAVRGDGRSVKTAYQQEFNEFLNRSIHVEI